MQQDCAPPPPRQARDRVEDAVRIAGREENNIMMVLVDRLSSLRCVGAISQVRPHAMMSIS